MIGLLLAASVLPGPQRASPLVIAADHHVHILGPGLLRDWKSLGVAFSRPDAAYLSPTAVLDGENAVGQALLVPMAHLYGNAEMREGLRLSAADERAAVRAENDYVAAQAMRWPGRAIAFCAVDWRRPYAWDELRRCREELKSPGIKLHLASAGTDLRDAAQRAELRRIAGWAEQQRLAVLLHLDPQRRGLQVADVERFLDEVLGPHRDLEVTVAHLGGSGGYGRWTRAVLRASTSWLEGERAAGRERSGVRFDVSATLLEKESEGVPPTTPKEARALGDDLRRLGLGRVLFASDYPVFAPRRLAELFAERTGLTPVELAQLLSNRAPVLARAAAPGRARAKLTRRPSLRGYGRAGPDGRPVTADTPFAIGSLSSRPPGASASASTSPSTSLLKIQRGLVRPSESADETWRCTMAAFAEPGCPQGAHVRELMGPAVADEARRCATRRLGD